MGLFRSTIRSMNWKGDRCATCGRMLTAGDSDDKRMFQKEARPCVVLKCARCGNLFCATCRPPLGGCKCNSTEFISTTMWSFDE